MQVRMRKHMIPGSAERPLARACDVHKRGLGLRTHKHLRPGSAERPFARACNVPSAARGKKGGGVPFWQEAAGTCARRWL